MANRLLIGFWLLVSLSHCYLGFHTQYKSAVRGVSTLSAMKFSREISMATSIESYVDHSNSRLWSESKEAAKIQEGSSIKLHLSYSSPVPRSYLPALLSYQMKMSEEPVDDEIFFATVESSLQWYLDNGGRISRLEFTVPEKLSRQISQLGFTAGENLLDESSSTHQLRKQVADSGTENFWVADPKLLIDHCKNRLSSGNGDVHILNDVIGRLYHDIGESKESIDYYTKSLQASPSSGSTFRNLGSAYHAIGNMQLAFASYQQALQLNPKDGLTYLKLALFYEEYAAKDWAEAADNALQCYNYYLDSVDGDDTSILTRLGNLLVREHKSEEAIKIYNRALLLDDKLQNAWFNKAHAELKLGDYAAAAVSLRKTLQIDSTVAAARHMLRALSEEEAVAASNVEDDYVKDLFNSYAQIYDEHGKKLLYSAPRIIRQEMAKIYKSKMGSLDDLNGSIGDQTDDDILSDRVSLGDGGFHLCDSHSLTSVSRDIDADHREAKVDPSMSADGSDSSCSTHHSFVNRTLEILDLGCGTGLAGAWLKDYAKSLIGVDISEQMVSLARKKMLYQELFVMPINEYLNKSKRKFDLVVAADVISYIGDLSEIVPMIFNAIRPGGHFVFTAEAASDDALSTERGFRLLRNGRFGYSKSYIDDLVKKLGEQHNIVLSREFSPRLDAGNPAPGFLYIIEKAIL